jgi:hypothetical protein
MNLPADRELLTDPRWVQGIFHVVIGVVVPLLIPPGFLPAGAGRFAVYAAIWVVLGLHWNGMTQVSRDDDNIYVLQGRETLTIPIDHIKEAYLYNSNWGRYYNGRWKVRFVDAHGDDDEVTFARPWNNGGMQDLAEEVDRRQRS